MPSAVGGGSRLHIYAALVASCWIHMGRGPLCPEAPFERALCFAAQLTSRLFRCRAVAADLGFANAPTQVCAQTGLRLKARLLAPRLFLPKMMSKSTSVAMNG